MTEPARRRQPPWLGAALALVAGAGAALAFPPFGFLPGLLGYGLLMWTLDTAAPRRPLASAFWRAWLAGTAYMLISTCWVAEAFFVDAATHGWQAPFAVALMASGLGVFWGVAGLLYRLLHVRGPLRVLVFAGTFCLLEWLRGHLFTGFPWDLAGESWRAGSAISQGAALVGAYGLSWFTVAIASAPALLFDIMQTLMERQSLALPPVEGGRVGVGGADFPKRTGPSAVLQPSATPIGCITPNPHPFPHQGGTGFTPAASVLVLVLTAFGALYGYGSARLAAAAAAPATAPMVRIVQADVEEAPSYSAELFRQIFGRYIALTARPAATPPAIVVWPEGAIPSAFNTFLANGTWTASTIAGALQPGQTLLTGGYRFTGPPDAPIYFNSLVGLRGRGEGVAITAVYDKYQLVPFGEYLPLAKLLTPLGLDKLVSVGDGFAVGPRPTPIHPDGAPAVQPLICYESLFPDLARTTPRPRWIVNVSDDAWFGRSYGPLQHLNLASYRAIEEGLPIVRATPTGISAVIDAYGRIAAGARLDQGAEGIVDARLPAALAPTPFALWGEFAFAGMLVLSCAAAIIGRMTQRHLDNG